MSGVSGSGFLRALTSIDDGDGIGGGGGPSCLTTDQNFDKARTQASSSGPWSDAGPWSGPWTVAPDPIAAPLMQPGIDEDIGGGSHVNRVTPYLAEQNGNVHVVINSFSANGGPAATEFGLLGGSQYFGSTTGPRTGTFDFAQFVFGPNAYIGWVSAGQVYNPDLLLDGYYEQQPEDMGDSAMSASVTAGPVLNATVPSGVFAMSMAYASGAIWNKDVVTVKLFFKFDAVSAGTDAYKATFTVGPASVTCGVDSTSGFVTLDGSGGSTSTASRSSWTPGTYYAVTILLNLPAGTISATVGQEDGLGASSGPLAGITNGERIFDGSYKPSVRVRYETTAAWTVNMKMVEALAYYPSTAVTTSLGQGFSTVVAPTSAGWGDGWEVWRTNTDPTDDAGLAWSSDGLGYGTVTCVNQAVVYPAHTRRSTSAGSVELRFEISNYPIEYEFCDFFFSLGTAFSSQEVNAVTLGTNLGMSVGTGAGAFTGASTTVFNAGTPVNVIIRWAYPTMSLTVWPAGGVEPTTPTLTFSRASTTALGRAQIIGFLPNLYTNGQRITIGPIAGEGSAAFKLAPNTVDMVPSVVDPSGGPESPYGRVKNWEAAYPGDGREYAVAWSSESYVTANVGTPGMDIWMVWAIVFGPSTDWGPGAVLAVDQSVSSKGFPKFLMNGVPVPFNVIITGEIGLGFGFGNGGTGSLGGSGVVELVAQIKSYNYGLGAGPIPPGTSEYFIGSGMAEATFSTSIVSGTPRRWFPFSVRLDASETDGGVTFDDDDFPHVQWGVDFYTDIEDRVRAAGPWTIPGPNWTQVHTAFRNLKFEMVPNFELAIGIEDPCDGTGGSGGGGTGLRIIPGTLLGSGNPRA